MSQDLILCEVHTFDITMKSDERICSECLVSESMAVQHKQVEKEKAMQTITKRQWKSAISAAVNAEVKANKKSWTKATVEQHVSQFLTEVGERSLTVKEGWKEAIKKAAKIKEESNMETITQKATHTATPWRSINGALFPMRQPGNVAIQHAIGIIGNWNGPRNASGNLESTEQDKVDAAFIVKAVNSHDALVRATQGALHYYLDVVGDTEPAFIKELQEALSLAEVKS